AEYGLRGGTDRRGVPGVRPAARAGGALRRRHLRQRTRGPRGVDRGARRGLGVLVAGAHADGLAGPGDPPGSLRTEAVTGGAPTGGDLRGPAGDRLRGEGHPGGRGVAPLI
ncbi:MAG: hypothetical protein AVDCRST_MAG12-882, partial [uncultured Rubrobacteraceae bacterium]